MRARRTEHTNRVLKLPGGTEDNDLWFYEVEQDGQRIICSVWVPTEEERNRIANGENIRLLVWGGHPPVALDITDEKIKGVDRATPPRSQ